MSISCILSFFSLRRYDSEHGGECAESKIKRVGKLMHLSHKLGKLSNQLAAGKCEKIVKVSKDIWDYWVHNFLCEKEITMETEGTGILGLVNLALVCIQP